MMKGLGCLEVVLSVSEIIKKNNNLEGGYW